MSLSVIDNKRKILNDPIYGFITIPDKLIFDLIEHPYFQRLRRISQLGLTNLVYSGANHTRFQHALGAMHLMSEAIEVIRNKGHEITDEEALGVTIAILLHDIGHGPYSHTLEHTIVQGVSHEQISLLFMDRLNQVFDGKLDIAIQIFKNEYPKKFLNQLVSGQLDVDRLDYLRRDSFFTGVSEGVIGVERIIKMMNVEDDGLVIDAKGIYSIEKFLVARRLMYWQVYLHKTVIAAETMLSGLLRRARELALAGKELYASDALRLFLYGNYNLSDFEENPALLEGFAALDDYDVLSAIKQWSSHDDRVLSTLSKNLINRKLLKVKIADVAFESSQVLEQQKHIAEMNGIDENEASYFVYTESMDNSAYTYDQKGILLRYKDGSTKDIAEAADLFKISALAKPVTKFFYCYPPGNSI